MKMLIPISLHSGETNFVLPCLSDGTFGSSITWPMCQDPDAAFTDPSEDPCYCIGDGGDMDAATEKMLRESLCLDEGRGAVTSSGSTPPSRKRFCSKTSKRLRLCKN